MTQGIDASVNPVKPPDRKPMLDRPPRETELDELTVRDHTMLSLREPGERVLVTWASYPRYAEG